MPLPVGGDRPGYFPTPAGPGGRQFAQLGGQGISVVANSDTQKAALEYIMWVVQPEVQATWWKLVGYSARRAAVEAPGVATSQPYAQTFLDSMTIVKDVRAEPSDASLLQASRRRFHNYVVAGGRTAGGRLTVRSGTGSKFSTKKANAEPAHAVDRAGPGPSGPRPRAPRPLHREEPPMSEKIINHAAPPTPQAAARRIMGLSDRAIAWIFVAPTLFSLLAVNIFALVWTIRLSFTSLRVNRANAEVEFVGLKNHAKILTDDDIWMTMQATAHFLIRTIALQVLIGFAPGCLINRKVRGNDAPTTIIAVPMMLGPAAAGTFRTFLYQPQIGPFNYAVGFLTGADPSSFSMIGDVAPTPWAIMVVDTWMCPPNATAPENGAGSGPSPLR